MKTRNVYVYLSVAEDGAPFADSFVTKELALAHHREWAMIGFAVGPIVRVQVPMPERKKK